MDDETRAKQLASLTLELGATYTLVINILARLPIPMLLPRNQADEPEWAVHSMSRAWELADAEQLPKLTVGRIREMITAWLTAYELAVVAASPAGPADWRLRGIDAALLRVRVSARYVDKQLTAFGR